MPIIEIDGIGRVEVGNEFLSLPPDRQAAEVDAIVASVRPTPSPAPTPQSGPVTAETAAPGSEEADFLAAVNRAQPTPDTLATRGDILPLGRTKEGDLVPALPSFLEGPRKTIVDILDGRRSAKDLSGKEIFELGTLFGGLSPATGTGKGVAAVAAERNAVRSAERAAPEAVEATAGGRVNAPVQSSNERSIPALEETKRRMLQEAETMDAVVAMPKTYLTRDEISAHKGIADMMRRNAAEIDQIVRLRTGQSTQRPVMPPPVVATEPPPAASASSPTQAAAPATRGALHSTQETLALRGAAKQDFKALDESGIVFNPQSFKPLTQEIFSEAASKGLDPTITPLSTAAIKRLTDLADQPITLQTLNTMREVAGAAAGSQIPKDRMIAELIIDRLDGFMNGLKAKDLIVGTEAEAAAVAQAVNRARKTWSEVAKLEVVSRLVQRANDAVANRPSLGIENSLRTEFTNLAKNDTQMRKFNAKEREAVRLISRGAGKATARALGRLAPTGPVSGLAVGGLAVAVGSKIGLDPMAATLVIGAPAFGARKLAGILTMRSVKKLESVIKAGGSDAELATGAAKRGADVLTRLGGNVATAAGATAATSKENR